MALTVNPEAFRVKVNGAWKNAAAYVKVGSAWKNVANPMTKVGGSWKNKPFLPGGVADPTWASLNDAFGQEVHVIAMQADGKYLVGGKFTNFYGDSAFRIARLNTDYTLDTEFSRNVGWGPYHRDKERDSSGYTNASTLNSYLSVSTINVQPDGKIIVGGHFDMWNGTTARGLVRLNADGSLDKTFATNLGSGFVMTGTYGLGFSYSLADSATPRSVTNPWLNGFAKITSGAIFTIRAVAIQSDGKILVGGRFMLFNGSTAKNIVRLNADGTLDTAWWANSGNGETFGYGSVYQVNSSTSTTYGVTVTAIALQSDGKAIVATDGATTWNGGAFTNGIVRLNADGTRDATFSAAIASTFANPVYAIAVQSNGYILAGARRMTPTGASDTTFNTNIGSYGANISAVCLDEPNMYFGGTSGVAKVDSTGVTITAFVSPALARRSTAYRYDNRANPGSTTPTIVNTIVKDGTSILIGGYFHSVAGTNRNNIARVSTLGAVMTPFPVTNTGLIGTGMDVAIQPDGKIIVVGSLTSINGTAVKNIARVNADGTVDTAFTANLGTGPDAAVTRVAVGSNGKIYCSGRFTTWNGTSVGLLVRLNSDGTRDTAFAPSIALLAVNQELTHEAPAEVKDSTIRSIRVQPDGKVLVCGWIGNGSTYMILARVNADGSMDTAFNAKIVASPPGTLPFRAVDIDLDSQGRIYVAGQSCFRVNADGGGLKILPEITQYAIVGTASRIRVQSNGNVIVARNGQQAPNFNVLVYTASTDSYAVDSTASSLRGGYSNMMTNNTTGPVTTTGYEPIRTFAMAVLPDDRIVSSGVGIVTLPAPPWYPTPAKMCSLQMRKADAKSPSDTTTNIDGAEVFLWSMQSTNINNAGAHGGTGNLAASRDAANIPVYGIAVQPDGMFVTVGVNEFRRFSGSVDGW